ncbi:hypothetical protein GCM10017586_24320 [Microbacterium imperiale]|uniref:Uncharacterized protein n=1 Tax=Microbacterium imperiale TaxID=33884 RepID=A0A9W6HHL4_9MICO|nr:hypothetical protein GCM10017586_24320 [Microbacterium imperiale]
MVHRRVPQLEQVPRRLSGTVRVVGLHDGEAIVERRIDDDEPQAGRRCGVASEPRRLVERDRSVDALVAQLGEGLRDVARTGDRHHGEGVVALPRRVGDGLQHAGVADRGESRDDEPDRAGLAGAQRAGGAMHAVAERRHGCLDAGSRLGIDARAAVGDARDGLRRDAGVCRHLGHRHAHVGPSVGCVDDSTTGM